MPMLQALIVDGRTALVAATSSGVLQASVIRSITVIRTLQTMFEGAWRNAAPVSERISSSNHPRTEVVRQILCCLCAGVTDEVAARQLSVSVRTYRRYVAEIMSMLGASSRFQAGVRAAELGLLPADGFTAGAHSGVGGAFRPGLPAAGRGGQPRRPGAGPRQ
ncbi:helix-turn-helix transcriptional regulator [Streptomyces sp. M2CJ-2]|uniref:response regulator transcription factor n=1 Tax=Streptomyces sp. M2CJ-2 TaxID=2803948 RepID=UPI0019276D7E|nr:helix-turn-helix transcriptional regulator [Streptomyces sp. M2CJ-2]MBL3669485.1 helix-turn-helix transcriptional regulator [Streptomyces sp. M2CJ-2]